MGRHSCCYKQKLRKGLWSPEEDEKLLRHITKYGHGCWSSVPKEAGLQRCGKSCRLRWINYLRPDLKRGTFSQEEENLIIELHEMLGNRWSQIATQLPGRTDNEIKNLWNSCIKKKLRQRGIDPNTHKPISDAGDMPKKTPAVGNKSGTKLSTPILENFRPSTAIDKSPSVLPPMADGFGVIENSGSTMEYFSMNYGSESIGPAATMTSENPLLWFNQTSRPFGVSSDYSTGTTLASVLPPLSTSASSVLSTAMGLKSIFNLLSENPPPPLPPLQNGGTLTGAQYWEGGGCASSNCSGTSGNSNRSSIEFHSNGSFFDGAAATGIFPWTELPPQKEEPQPHHVNLEEGETEDFKWSELLHTVSTPLQAIQGNQGQNLFNGEAKLETQFGFGGSNTLDHHHHHHQQQQQQTNEYQQQHHQLEVSDIYGKDFHRLSAAFEQL